MATGGQVALSLGMHPERLASLRFIVSSSLGLVLGSAIIASGMLGLAEGYEKIAGQLAWLLGTKQIAESLELSVSNRQHLEAHNQGFWKAYLNSSLAVCLFLGGFLLLAILSSALAFELYIAGLIGGAIVLGSLVLVLAVRGLSTLRRTHRSVETSVQVLAEQPDRSEESRAASAVGRPKESRRPRRIAYGRSLESRRPPTSPRRH